MRTIYWITTGLLASATLLSAYTYIFSQAIIQGVRELGFPDAFRMQLAVMKVIAAVVLVLPMLPLRVKEWAYVGIALFLVTAIVAHTAHNDPFVLTLVNLCIFAVLVVSNITLYSTLR